VTHLNTSALRDIGDALAAGLGFERTAEDSLIWSIGAMRVAPVSDGESYGWKVWKNEGGGPLVIETSARSAFLMAWLVDSHLAR